MINNNVNFKKSCVRFLTFLESQIPTQRYGRRPFGVGLLVAGYDVSNEIDIFLQLKCS